MSRNYFPVITPTKRQFDAGTFPIKTFKSQSGAERRILYGSRRSSMKLQLRFENISDTKAEEILTHYDERLGSYSPFYISNPNGDSTGNKAGWEGGTSNLQGIYNQAFINQWRYAAPPSVVQVQNGISSVTVDLISVI